MKRSEIEKKFPFLSEVEKNLGHRFKDKRLLLNAMVHRSFLNENQDLEIENNERLEFLGDSILGLIVAEYLYLKLPDTPEGELSDFRSRLVDATACMNYLHKLKLEQHLLLGKGEKVNIGRGRESILSDLFEALIGALYLDAGLKGAMHFFFTRFQKEVDAILASPIRNFKAELQDYSQKRYQKVPLYEVTKESGPSHNRQFVVGVWVNEKKVGEGEGKSKKQAQAKAAEAALLQFGIDDE